MSNEYKPHIGKNVIETLTLGMYEDPRFIYREYVQNAADQIDVAVEQEILKNRNEGTIKIEIDNVTCNENMRQRDNMKASIVRRYNLIINHGGKEEEIYGVKAQSGILISSDSLSLHCPMASRMLIPSRMKFPCRGL